MKFKPKLMVFCIFLFVFSEQVLALRCGHRVVDVGAKKSKVISRCGEPLYVETRERKYPFYCIDRGVSVYNGQYGNSFYDNRYQNQGNFLSYPVCRIEIIEVWTYSFGPRKFMRELIFRKGILAEINLLGYGN